MRLENIEYRFNQGYPEMHMVVDGVQTVVPVEQKAMLLRNGVVYLGSELEGAISTKYNGQTIPGGTRDSDAVVAVFKFVLAARDGKIRESNLFVQ